MTGMTVRYSLYLVFCVVTWRNVCGQDVIFDPGNSSGGTCITREGKPGRCVDIDKCPGIQKTFLTGGPVHCGFNGRLPIVCCPVDEGPVTEDPTAPVPVLDISPPEFSSSSDCGRSAVKKIRGPPGVFPGPILGVPRPSGISIPVIGALRPGGSSDTTLSARRKKRSNVNFNLPLDIEITAIAGGIESQRNAWPWMALIGTKEGNNNYNWFCAGALINDQWVLTAAHCLDFNTPDVIRLGEHDHSTTSDGADHVDYGILKMIRHPSYAYPVAYHDLALIQLSTNVTIQTFIRPVCLPWGQESVKPLTGRQVTVTGWGDTEFHGKPSNTLQEVRITMFSTAECQEKYKNNRQFRENWPNGMGSETSCAGDRNGGRDACQGDSGGPITYFSKGRYIANGVVSRGYGCGHKDYPGTYSNLQNAPYLAWIKKVAF